MLDVVVVASSHPVSGFCLKSLVFHPHTAAFGLFEFFMPPVFPPGEVFHIPCHPGQVTVGSNSFHGDVSPSNIQDIIPE